MVRPPHALSQALVLGLVSLSLGCQHTSPSEACGRMCQVEVDCHPTVDVNACVVACRDAIPNDEADAPCADAFVEELVCAADLACPDFESYQMDLATHPCRAQQIRTQDLCATP